MCWTPPVRVPDMTPEVATVRMWTLLAFTEKRHCRGHHTGATDKKAPYSCMLSLYNSFKKHRTRMQQRSIPHIPPTTGTPGGLRTVGVGQRLTKHIFLGKPKYQAQCLKRSLLKARSLTQELEMALLRSEGLVGARSYGKPCCHDVQLKKPWRNESPYICGAVGQQFRM